MHEVRVIAPAKVNLALRVGATRPDGYHPLETVFEALDLSDEIVAREAEGLSLTIEGIGADTLTTGPENLVLRAAEPLRAADPAWRQALSATLEDLEERCP